MGSFLKKKKPEVQNLIQALEKISVEKSWNLSMGRIATLVFTIIFYRSCKMNCIICMYIRPAEGTFRNLEIKRRHPKPGFGRWPKKRK